MTCLQMLNKVGWKLFQEKMKNGSPRVVCAGKHPCCACYVISPFFNCIPDIDTTYVFVTYIFITGLDISPIFG